MIRLEYKIISEDDLLLINLSKLKNKKITIILPSNYKRPTITCNNRLVVSSVKEKVFLELDDKYEKKKIMKKRSKPSPVADKKFYELSPEDWRPKHIVQYFRSKYKKEYDVIPLQLDWNDSGHVRSGQARERSKCWAYAKHLTDKFNSKNINIKRFKHYIDWTFDEFDINPTMALISCNSWIDQYLLKVVKKRKRMNENKEDWDKKIEKLERKSK